MIQLNHANGSLRRRITIAALRQGSAKQELMKGLYILDLERLDFIYGATEREAIEQRVEIIAPPQDANSIAATPEILSGIEVIFAGPGMPRMNELFLSHAPDLKAVFYAGDDTGNFLTDLVSERGIAISTAGDADTGSAIEALVSQMVFTLRSESSPRRVAGLLSFGSVCRQVREKLQDSNVLVCDPNASPEEAAALEIELSPLDDVFRRADVIACYSPWLEKTGKMIGQEHLALMKPGATLIALAGGNLVDESALLDALHRRGDVSLVMTGGTRDHARSAAGWVVEELDRYLAGEPLKWDITRPGADNAAPSTPPQEPEDLVALADNSSSRPPQPVVPPGLPISLAETALPIPAPTAAVRWWKRSSFLIISIALHLLFAAAATYFVVSRYAAPRKLTFKAGPPSPNPSKRAIEHKVQMAKKQNTASAPPMSKRIVTSGLAKVSLPPMPAMPAPPNAPPSKMAGMGMSAGFGQGGFSAGGGSMGSGGGPPISFFGIKDAARSVVIMIDVSDSMFTRTGDAESRKLVRQGKEQSFQTIRDEAIKLLESLTPNTRFGIVRWSGGAYSWKPELVPATPENKQAAIEHVQNEVDMTSARPKGGRPGGTRHDYAIEEAFALKPELIYMLTDGNATASQPGGGMSPIDPKDIWDVANTAQKTLSKEARLHVVYYVTGADKEEERRMLKTLASRNGGKFREVEAKGRKK